jgi:hypothetical protein
MWLPKANGKTIESEVLISIQEMCRVLKDDGEIRIWPIEKESKKRAERDWTDTLENNLGVRTLKWLKDNDFEATLGEIKPGRTEEPPLVIKKKD